MTAEKIIVELDLKQITTGRKIAQALRDEAEFFDTFIGKDSLETELNPGDEWSITDSSDTIVLGKVTIE